MKFSLPSYLLAFAAIAIAPSFASADVIGFEDFDGGAINLTSTERVEFYNAGGGSLGDVMGIVSSVAGGGVGGPFDVWDDTVADNSGGDVNPGDQLGVAGQNTTAFFAMNDMDGSAGPGFADSIWSFDISSAASIENIQMDIGAIGDFEAGSEDGFLIEARIDGGAYSEIFRGTTDESAFKEYRPLDNGFVFADDDPLELSIDGVATGTFLDKSDATTGLFDTYTSTLFAGQSGNNLDIRISWSGTPSGTEPMGFDNFVINGAAIPEPGSVAFLGLISLVGLARRRK